MDISDWQMSWVGLGIIQRGQDYKALTLLYWSLPLSFVGRGTSSDEALEVGNKNRTAVYPLFSPCSPPTSRLVCPPHRNLLCCLCLSIVNISCLLSHFGAPASPSPFVCSLNLFSSTCRCIWSSKSYFVVFFCCCFFFQEKCFGDKEACAFVKTE